MPGSEADRAIRHALATDADLNRVLDEQYINLPDPPEPPPTDYDAMSLAELLDDLVDRAETYYLYNGDDYAGELAAARARVDERLKKAGLL